MHSLLALKETAAHAQEAGAQAHIFVADVRHEAAVEELEQAVAAQFGHVNILINNAGVMQGKHLVDCTLAEWRNVIDANLISVFLMCRSIIPLIRGRANAHIINIASTMSHVALPGRTAYCASKAGFLGLTRSLALELAGDSIGVVSISPGPFATEMAAPLQSDPGLNAQILSKVPLAQWGDPKDIGRLVRFLCSEDAGYITGTDILIDGGWTAQ